jgi:hypothetical protein
MPPDQRNGPGAAEPAAPPPRHTTARGRATRGHTGGLGVQGHGAVERQRQGRHGYRHDRHRRRQVVLEAAQRPALVEPHFEVVGADQDQRDWDTEHRRRRGGHQGLHQQDQRQGQGGRDEPRLLRQRRPDRHLHRKGDATRPPSRRRPPGAAATSAPPSVAHTTARKPAASCSLTTPRARSAFPVSSSTGGQRHEGTVHDTACRERSLHDTLENRGVQRATEGTRL